LELELLSRRKVVPFEFIFYLAKFGKIWNLESTPFHFASLNGFGYWKMSG
jgi:hypothetical protein